MSRRRIAVPLILVLLSASAQGRPLGTPEGMEVRTSAERSEEYERDVDQVAAASQEQAIAKLSALLKKYRDTPQEPGLLARLAEFQQQYSAILFRIGHGYSKRNGGSDLTRYSKSLHQNISTLNTLIKKYPNYEGVPHAYFMRAKDFDEVGNKKASVADYEYLVKHFPEADDTPAAYMALADVAINANDHPKAIQYLGEVEKLPGDPHFPFALYKLAWSYYNLKNVPRGLSYLERHIEYYRALRAEAAVKGAVQEQDAVNSDRALQENSLLDVVLFYFEGYEQNDPHYRLADTLGYFKRLEPGLIFGRMLVKMSKLLRSHGHEADLIAWKDQVLLAEGNLPESLEVALTTYEFQLNKRRYPQVVDSARDFVAIYSKHAGQDGFKPLFTHAQKLLIDTAEGLQSVIIKNRGNEEIKGLSATLAAIYESFTRIVEDSDPRVPRVHYNLAETLFAIQDYDGATEHYRWVAVRGEGDPDASLKAISSRYEVLRLKQLADREIKAVGLPSGTTGEEFQNLFKLNLDSRLLQWVSWIDDHLAKFQNTKLADSEKVESFLFEANRALYANGQVAAATQRLKSFAESRPKSKFAIPAATLVVDTYIATAHWEKTHELVLGFLEEKSWTGTGFGARLSALAADSYFKVMEEKFGRKEYAQVLKDCGKFLKKYEKSERLPDGLRLAGQSALAVGDKLLARHYFSRLIQESPKADGLGDALLARGGLAEENYEFRAAASDYSGFLALTGERYRKAQTDALRKKVLMLSWLSGDVGDWRAALNNRAICSESLAEDCERLEAQISLATPERSGTEEVAEESLKRAKATSGANRVLWSLVALEGAKYLEYRDRVYLMRQVASNWDELDSISKYSVLPQVSRSVTRAFAFNRKEMNEIAPLRANEKYIKRRVEVLREMENAATKAMNLPWVRLRAELLNEVAQLYLDFSKDLSKLPPPKNLPAEEVTLYEETVRKLVLPFEEKGQDLRRKAFELASKYFIEDEALKAIVDPFFSENPSQAKTLKPSVILPPPAELGLDYLNVLDPTGEWRVFTRPTRKTENLEITQPQMRFKQLWASALLSGNWPQVAFIMSEAKQKRVVSDGVLSIMRAIALGRAGARGEGLLELDAARKDLPPESGNNIALTLIAYSARAYSKERIAEWLSSLKLEQLNSVQKNVMLAATAYIGSEAKKH